GRELRADAREFGALAGGFEELLEVLIEKLDRTAAAILQPEREAAGVAEAGDRRRHEGECVRLWNIAAEFAVEPFEDRPRVVARAALIPRLKRDEIEAVVARRDARQQAEPGDGVVGPHALCLGEDLFDLAADEIRSFERRRGRELDVQEEVAL